MFVAILAVVSLAYVAVVSAFAVGAASLRRGSRRERLLGDDALPRAAVILPARDEQHLLPRCLDALLMQDYPADKLLVVVIDDHSEDGTAAVIARYRQAVQLALVPEPVPAGTEGARDDLPTVPFAGDGLPGPAAGPRVVGLRTPEGGTLRGKAAALHAGILAAEEFDPEVYLLTDADCAPPPQWCRAMASLLSQPEVGIACGRTEVAQDGTHLAAMQALDWTYLLTAAAVLTERVRPATGMGNNMGIRRQAYEEVGGYHGVRFSVTEDHALFHAVSTRTDWGARFPLHPEMAVQTLPLPRLRDVYTQRRRWARGGVLAGPMLFALYALVYFGTLAPLVAMGMAFAGLFPLAGAGALVVAKCLVDLVLFRSALPPEQRGQLRALLAVEGFLTLYFSTVPLTILLLPRINWKGRSH